jgi:succinoglycan biosynthesis protein ExoA
VSRNHLPPLPDAPRISVVIPARGCHATLEAAVASVLAQDPAPAEVVIAVGPSSDGTAALAARLAAEHPQLRVVDNPSGRTPEALNTAIAASGGQIVARVDAQAQLPAGYLGAAVAALRGTSAANVGGLQIPTAETGFSRAVAAAMRSPLGTGGAAYRTATEPGPVDTVYLGVFRREALEAVGGFDPTFVRNQDAELNLRLREAGYVVWLEPAMRVAYRPRASVRALASQYLQYGRWRRLTARHHPGSLRPRQLVPPLVSAALVGAAGLSIATRDRRAVQLVAGGYMGVVGIGGLLASTKLSDVPGTTLALVVMHLSWGAGFLIGPPRGS